MAREYMIVLAAKNTSQNIAECIQTSTSTVRKNDNETKFIVKYPEESPPSWRGAELRFTLAGILTELAKPEWQEDYPL